MDSKNKRSEYYRLRYLKEKNKRLKERRTVEGVLHQRWRGIIQRCDGKTGHWTTANGKKHLTQEDFYKWVLKDRVFMKLYNEWVKSNYETNKSPSIDRLDITKGYFIENMKWMTMRENNSKAQKDWLCVFGRSFHPSKKVRLWNENGDELSFDSGKEASEYFGKNRLAVTNNIIMGHKLQGWNCEWK